MIGIIFFWLDYITCGLALYSFIFCRYKLERVQGMYSLKTEMEPTKERIKTPLWQVLLLILLYIIPVLNILILPIMVFHYSENNYCYKSFLTKEI